MGTPPNIGDDGTDPVDCTEGTERKLLFRRWNGAMSTNRSVAGLLGLFYSGPLFADMDAVKEHAAVNHGPGEYKLVSQRVNAGRWRYVESVTVPVFPRREPVALFDGPPSKV